MRASVARRVIGLTLLAACNSSDSGRRVPAVTVAGAGARLDSLLKQADAVYLGSTDRAAVLWRQALPLAESLGDSVSRARILTGLGGAAWRRSEYDDARRLFEESLVLKRRLGMKRDLYRSINGLGLVALDQEQLADAMRYFAEAAEAAQDVGDRSGVAKSSTNTGLVLQDLGDYAGARRAFQRGRDGTRAAGDSVNLGKALNNLAGLDIALGDPVSALASLEEARRLFRAQGDSIGELNARGQLATAYDALGEPQRAFAALDSAIGMGQRMGARREVAQNLQLMADFFWTARDSRRALDYYTRALTANDSLGLPEERGNLLRSMGAVHAASGSLRLAMQLTGEALTVHRGARLGYPELVDRLLLAELAQRTGNASEASGQLRAARALSTALNNQVADGLVAISEARVAVEGRQWQRALNALDTLRASLALIGAEGTAEVWALRAHALGQLGSVNAALAAGRQSIAAIERVRGNYGSGELRTSYASSKSGVYANQVLLLLSAGRLQEAFDVADAARGRALVEHLLSARADIDTSSAMGRLLEREQLLRKIDALTAQLRRRDSLPSRERLPNFLDVTRGLSDSLTAARREYEALLARSDATSSPSAALLSTTRDGARTVQRALERNEAVIEYLVTRNEVLIFVVTAEGLSLYRSPETAVSLTARVQLARELVANGATTPPPTAVLRALYDLLVKPVQLSGALRHVERLIIVPHGVLAYLPYSALIDTQTGKYLAEEFFLLRVPTAGSLSALRASGRRAGLALREHAAAIFAPLPLELPATQDEARVIRRALTNATMLVGTAATEPAVRRSLESGAIVHIATHAILNAGNPLFSRIELAGRANGPALNNGRLEVHELLRLALSSPLVFLSGCETGLGGAWSTPFDTGEDFTTLGQALLLAGASNVVATLWRIDDAGASVFAGRFYEAGLRLLPPEALASAQRQMIADPRYANPYYWAAYEISGNGAWGR